MISSFCLPTSKGTQAIQRSWTSSQRKRSKSVTKQANIAANATKDVSPPKQPQPPARGKPCVVPAVNVSHHQNQIHQTPIKDEKNPEVRVLLPISSHQQGHRSESHDSPGVTDRQSRTPTKSRSRNRCRSEPRRRKTEIVNQQLDQAEELEKKLLPADVCQNLFAHQQQNYHQRQQKKFNTLAVPRETKEGPAQRVSFDIDVIEKAPPVPLKINLDLNSRLARTPADTLRRDVKTKWRGAANVPLVLVHSCLLHLSNDTSGVEPRVSTDKTGNEFIDRCVKKVSLPFGTVVNGLCRQGDYVLVRTPHELTGYVNVRYVTPLGIPPTSTSQALSASSNLQPWENPPEQLDKDNKPSLRRKPKDHSYRGQSAKVCNIEFSSQESLNKVTVPLLGWEGGHSAAQLPSVMMAAKGYEALRRASRKERLGTEELTVIRLEPKQDKNANEVQREDPPRKIETKNAASQTTQDFFNQQFEQKPQKLQRSASAMAVALDTPSLLVTEPSPLYSEFDKLSISSKSDWDFDTKALVDPESRKIWAKTNPVAWRVECEITVPDLKSHGNLPNRTDSEKINHFRASYV